MCSRKTCSCVTTLKYRYLLSPPFFLGNVAAIDGDGMVCALTFKDGRVHFRSKFVSTKHRREESEKQNFIYMGQMGTRATGVLAETANTVWNLLQGKFPKIKFRNPSNTNSFYWGGKVREFGLLVPPSPSASHLSPPLHPVKRQHNYTTAKFHDRL